MIRKVSSRGKRITIDWDQKDYDFFFLHGLQMLADEHFKGERKVVVLPVDAVKLDKKAKSIEVSDGFSNFCVSKAVNQCIRDFLDKLKASDNPVEIPPRAMIIGPDFLIHKAVEGRPFGQQEAICGVKKARQTTAEWSRVSCSKCRKEGLRKIIEACQPDRVVHRGKKK